MSVERKQRLFEVLDAALEQPAVERATFLDQECGDDTPLRREVEALLDTEVDGGLLAEPAFSIHAEDAGVGRRIGPYQLVRLLDRGGMGAVYLAEREDFEQRVALKLIRRGLDADELLVRRFQNERQILARLEHPNIARLLDGGTTEDRLPYFVMEVVEGEPIDRYCRDRKLSVEARLELFRKVCAAVQFAHQNLVIHRDLKPGNILITADGEPKLLDFGIAKLLDDSLAARALETELGQGPMTPRYASPEQIRLEAVTTASDVYSLGVLLYELLTGLDPYDVQGRRGDEVARAVCDQEPDRPSTAVRRRTAEPEAPATRRLQRRLSGDLDSVVLKAMRKEPKERYASAEQLSDDLRRHLIGMPVDAQTGSFRYRAGKFVRRHRLGMAVAAAFLIVILGFTALSTVLWQQAVRERERSASIALFLKDLFKANDPDQPTTTDTSLDLFKRGLELLGTSLEEEPEYKMIIAGTLGEISRKQGLYAEAKDMMVEALRASRELYAGDHREVAKRLGNLGVLYNDYEDYAKAETLFRQALDMRQRLGQDPADLVRTQSNLATSLMLQGEFQDAEKLYEKALETRIAGASGPDDPHVASSRRNLAALYLATGEQLQKAESLLREALKTRRRVYNSENTLVASVLDLLGSVLAAQSQDDEAEKTYNEALGIRRRLLGDDHLDVAKTEKNLAALLARTETSRARKLIDHARAMFDEVAPTSWEAAEAKSVLGDILMNQERLEESEQNLITGFEELRRLRGRHDFRTRRARERLLDLSERSGRPERLERYRESTVVQ